MKSPRTSKRIALATITLLFSFSACSATSRARANDQKHLRFQKPSQVALGSRASSAKLRFRSPSEQRPVAASLSAKRAVVERVSHEPSVNDIKRSAKAATPRRKEAASSTKNTKPARTARKKKSVQNDRHITQTAEQWVEYPSEPVDELPILFGDGGGFVDGCASEVGCGLAEPGCAIVEPGCCIEEAACGIAEPDCGLADPSCGITDCGSCVGRPGPDYWCFPICLPRFKDLSVWVGVHGFRGPRDFSSGRSDSNFGFQEGINISGRAPLVGLLLPQLSYQLGYQAVQSRLSGTLTSPDDRSQEFLTAGLFRRVETGLQFGVVWDYMRDDIDIQANFQQIRTEISIRSPLGREIGFWSTSHTNSTDIAGVTYQAVNQYALFYRWNFGKGTECRAWVGGTDDSEAILGAEFYTPLNDRWSLQSGFNYLITDQSAGPLGVSEESWNLGINLVWHMGRTARRGQRSPFRPMFAVVDNGWMFVDEKP